MANILITNRCNLNCPYCFADNVINNEKQFITIEQLKNILNYISKSKNNPSIGLIGGEPTIHPNFNEILDTLIEYSLNHRNQLKLFTNGIKLGDFADKLNKKFSVLVNCNSPEIIGEDNFNKIKYSLNKCISNNTINQIGLGINLYKGLPDYQFVLDLALEYGKKEIRTSYVAPTSIQDKLDKDKYYNDGKELFLSFIKDCEIYNITARIDCNHIPLCYFNDEEKILVTKVCKNINNYCDPVIDITPDMKATCCFGTYDLIDLKDFDNLNDVSRYFLFDRIYNKTMSNCTGKCANCDKLKKFTCQGGCLAFARER